MSRTKEMLGRNQPVLGGWLMTGSPVVAEIMTGEAFDFLGVDMEHTAIGLEEFHRVALAAKGSGCDLLARLPSCDPVAAKKVLDLGAAGIIVPSVNSPEEAAQSVAMARFPPDGVRGASLCRATGYGTDFAGYFGAHNRSVVVVVMIEHIRGVERADEILAVPGIDAVLIGPYDLSASMGLAGQLDHPRVRAAQQSILDACRRNGVAPGIHVVPVDADEVRRRVGDGFRFIACGIDTLFIREGCRRMLAARG
ncbi:MAG: 2,4-dihydroxyhept-2-ene-1,7-dioic acid aldolase [Lentisphaerae bacterium]|nr:2,4-dihydroxyhept-2-ene-1,7-dioic acid aldolase [Lentisphaerota bacterium]